MDALVAGTRYGSPDVAALVDVARDRLRRKNAIVEAAAEGLFTVSADGCLDYMNPAAERMTGFTVQELRGKHVHDAIHHHDAAGRAVPMEECPVFHAIRDGITVRSRGDVFWRKDGTSFPVEWSSSPIVQDGRITGAVIILTDITARRAAERELEASRSQVARSEKLSALGTLVSGVAHEIRTPLTYVSNNLYLIQHRLERAAGSDPALAELAAEVRRYSQSALEGMDRINRLVADLRRSARLDTGARAAADLAALVQEGVGLFRAAQRGHIQVVMDLSPAPQAMVNREQIQQVLFNLLLNASDAMPRGGLVRVATRPAPGGAEITVEDQGPGLPPEVQARLFDPFFTTKREGTGLGLSISKRIVDAHGGSIRFETEAGKGTRFIIFLPDRSQATAPPPP